MKSQALLSIDGYNYMSAQTAADLWGLKRKTVAEYCRNNKIKNKFKNGNCGWYIRTDEIKPLSQREIRKLLVFTLQLKNNPSCEIDWTLFNYNEAILENLYNHLFYQGYIHPFSIESKKRIPYEVVLTQKGMDLVAFVENKKTTEFAVSLTQWLPIVISIAQLYFQINP